MIKFRRIEISNFVCFDNIAIEPSTDPAKPLTVVRAENGSGKTTLLRAIRWGMYGEKGLPTPQSRFSLHPAWWTPDDNGKRTEVSIEFETDGSDRFNETDSTKNMLFQLKRSVTTLGKPIDNKNDPNFYRIDEQTQLMMQGIDGLWTPHTAGVGLVVDQLLPWDLRDFFVMDADEVVDFVGGTNDNKILHKNQIIAKTTDAVNGLLGLDIFKMVQTRVDNIGREFGRQATAAVGDSTLDDLQSRLERHRSERKELEKKISAYQKKRDDIVDGLRERNIALQNSLKGIGAAEELSPRLGNNRRAYRKLSEKRKEVIHLLAGQVESTDLLTTMSHAYISKSYNILKPLYDIGYIPAKHLHYVRALLESGTCVCGQDISHENIYRKRVSNLISESSEGEDRSNYLSQIFDATRSLIELVPADIWSEQCHNLTSDLVDIDSQISDLQIEHEEIQIKLDRIDEDKIQIFRSEIDSLNSQLDSVKLILAGDENRLPSLIEDIQSLAKQLGQRQRQEIAARDKQEAESVAKNIVRALDRGYSTIQVDQVTQLSDKMDDLFSRMVFNVTDEDIEHKPDKVDIRMIAKVGIKSAEGRPNEFEIFCHNNLGFNMPPIIINGASRRILALSFVLALCVESRTFAPLIADSLLNFMTGAVRRNTLLITAQTSSQPILLLTSADLALQSEIDIIDEYAGATYALTGQWDAIDAGFGGDVLNWNDKRSVSLICPCGPRNYCNVCERVGWAELPGWKKRETKGELV